MLEPRRRWFGLSICRGDETFPHTDELVSYTRPAWFNRLFFRKVRVSKPLRGYAMSKNDIAAINRLSRQWVSAVNAGDADAWQETFTKNFVWIPPDVRKLVGRKAVTAFGKTAFLDPFKLRLKQRLSQIEIFSPRALAIGSFTIDMTPKGGGDTIKRSGNFMWVFQKEKRSWKIAKAIFNFDKPAN
jgi:uncharacterized protein (TIGR02246 family)